MDSKGLNNDDMVLDAAVEITAKNVHEVIGKHMLADGFSIVLDLDKSRGNKIVDGRTGEEYIDLFTFFASNALGMNHPKLNNKEFIEKIGKAAVNKPSNSDIYTTEMAEFVETFARVAKPEYMKYLFFVSGGALAVENALKVAFDWKVQKNFEKGYKEEKGHKVIHFKEAFHGRSGYTMSLTNTDPNKIKYFPKFDWPRISNPKVTFPIEDNLEKIKKAEEQAVNEIMDAIKNNKDDIAALIIEPIQGEGGDNFFRKEFFEKLREITLQNEILLIFDEVQTGFGLTGKFWASDYYVQPDIISFGKKAQVCGIMASPRVDEVKENCFHKSSRINSTWGGNLVDMVRSTRILQVIEEENLVENSRALGEYLLEKLKELQSKYSSLVNNARGKGLMCSFDMKDAETRNKFLEMALKEKLLILGCGQKAIRFRPPLTSSKEELNEGLNIIERVLSLLSSNN